MEREPIRCFVPIAEIGLTKIDVKGGHRSERADSVRTVWLADDENGCWCHASNNSRPGIDSEAGPYTTAVLGSGRGVLLGYLHRTHMVCVPCRRSARHGFQRRAAEGRSRAKAR